MVFHWVFEDNALRAFLEEGLSRCEECSKGTLTCASNDVRGRWKAQLERTPRWNGRKWVCRDPLREGLDSKNTHTAEARMRPGESGRMAGYVGVFFDERGTRRTRGIRRGGAGVAYGHDGMRCRSDAQVSRPSTYVILLIYSLTQDATRFRVAFRHRISQPCRRRRFFAGCAACLEERLRDLDSESEMTEVIGP